MDRDLIVDIGIYCKNVRLNQNMSLKEFAILNNDNLKNIWAFENGRANNIKYIFYYFNIKRKGSSCVGHCFSVSNLLRPTPQNLINYDRRFYRCSF